MNLNSNYAKTKGGRSLFLFAKKQHNKTKKTFTGKSCAQKWPGFFICLFDYQKISPVKFIIATRSLDFIIKHSLCNDRKKNFVKKIFFWVICPLSIFLDFSVYLKSNFAKTERDRCLKLITSIRYCFVGKDLYISLCFSYNDV